MRRDVATLKHILKIIGNTSMIDYANKALAGVVVKPSILTAGGAQG